MKQLTPKANLKMNHDDLYFLFPNEAKGMSLPMADLIDGEGGYLTIQEMIDLKPNWNETPLGDNHFLFRYSATFREQKDVDTALKAQNYVNISDTKDAEDTDIYAIPSNHYGVYPRWQVQILVSKIINQE